MVQTQGAATSAPDLTPAQVPLATGRAETADIPKLGAAPGGGDRVPQPVPTNGPAAGQKPQPPKGPVTVDDMLKVMDASAVFEQVKNLPAGELDTLIAAIEGELANYDDDGDEEVGLDEPSTSPKRGARARAEIEIDEPIGYGRLDRGSQAAIGAVHSHLVERAIDRALDSDQELSYNMKAANPKAQESVKSIIRDRLRRFVDERGDRFDYNWDNAVRQAVAAEKARLIPLFERPARPGMGPGSQTDFQVNRELKAPERVPAFADDREYDEYLGESLRYNQALIERERDNMPGA
ncbi:hypothetical protein AMJ85_00245 [candidate division BRC1 bacterium SM23_51]|nr:MAG: hypothetical protein AMJ85_00245 [candidate division BRC1 bacterium SM23_51]